MAAKVSLSVLPAEKGCPHALPLKWIPASSYQLWGRDYNAPTEAPGQEAVCAEEPRFSQPKSAAHAPAQPGPASLSVARPPPGRPANACLHRASFVKYTFMSVVI